MKIKAEVTACVSNGFYCKLNGKTICYYLKSKDNLPPSCNLFNLFLKVDSKGNILKCEDCLLAEREAKLRK